MIDPYSNLRSQLQFLRQVEHYAKSGSREDCENVKDLFNLLFQSFQTPCSQIQKIRDILPKDSGELYQPDEITRLAKRGIDLLIKEMGALSK